MSDWGLDYIRNAYNVPAKTGQRVQLTDSRAGEFGTIVGGCAGKLHIRVDGKKTTRIVHPTCEHLRYVEGEQEPTE